MRRKECADIGAESLQFADHARRYGAQFGQALKNNRFESGKLSVDVGHVAFVFKVLDRTYAFDGAACPRVAGGIDSKAAEGCHSDAWFVGVELPYGFGACPGIGFCAFGCVAAYSYYYGIEQAQCAVDD